MNNEWLNKCKAMTIDNRLSNLEAFYAKRDEDWRSQVARLNEIVKEIDKLRESIEELKSKKIGRPSKGAKSNE
jgi:hypothetical protein